MAELLGGQAIIDSLRTDVQDLQWAVTDLISRVGPVECMSWKFPDKKSYEVDVEELLDLYSYSDDVEDNQVAHIALYELVIDRFLYFIHALSSHTNQLLSRAGGEKSHGKSTSIGLIVKRYCSKQVQLNTIVQQTMSDSKSKTRKVADMESNMKKMTEEFEKLTNSDTGSTASLPYQLSPHKVGSAMSGFITPSKIEEISRDACSKCCQTVETAFVPCEGCHVVQKNFRNAGDVIVKMCQSQKLPSTLQKYQPLVADVKWLTPNDVARWSSEMTKDLGRIDKHMDYLMSTINPLKEEIEMHELNKKRLEKRVANFDADMRKEKEVQYALQRQFDVKMKELEDDHKQTVAMVTKQKEELTRTKQLLETNLEKCKQELEVTHERLTELDKTKQVLERDLQDNRTNCKEVERLQGEITRLQDHLQEIEIKLQRSTKELSKEQARNKSASKHSKSLQSKQDNLLHKVDTLDQENEELKEQVAEIEEEKDKIQETLDTVQVKVKKYQQKIKQNENLIEQLKTEKEDLEVSAVKLKEDVEKIGHQLEEAQERERLLIEYPDLNGPVNQDFKGTGDLATDMENQVKANSIRIQVLEEQNETLRNSISKVLAMQDGRSQPKVAWEKESERVPLWNKESIENARYEGHQRNNMWNPEESHQSENINYNANPLFTINAEERVIDKVPTKVSNLKPSPEEFLVGRASRPPSAAKRRTTPGSRPVSGKKLVTAPVNTTSIGAYIQLKKAGKLDHYNDGLEVKPSHQQCDYKKKEMFSCHRCDKMYSKQRDLEIHKSYCTA